MNTTTLKTLIDEKIKNQGNQIRASVLVDVLNELIKPYASLERLRPYVYKISFDELPEDSGIDAPIVISGCSAYVANEKLYRTLDFLYDEAASFWIRTKDFEGMSFITGLNDGDLDIDLLNQLPFRIVDGVNIHGIRVSTHVLFNDWEWAGAGAKNIPLNRLPFLALTKVKSMATIATDLQGILENLALTTSFETSGYLIQVLVTDGLTTYAILPPTEAGKAFILQDISANPKLANFRWVNSALVEKDTLQERPTGVERFNSMPCSLADLRFTKCYEEPIRLSEFIGIDKTTKDSTDEELTAIYNKAKALYLSRQRDGKTWQTMHAVVYGNKLEELYVQENFEDNLIASSVTPQGVLFIQSAQNTTIGGYSIPSLTVDQVTQAYNAIVAGRGCIIVDLDETMHAYVNQADCLNNELSICILFYSTLLLTYTIVDSAVTITHVEL